MATHDRSTYEKDLAALIKNQTDIIKQQVLLEIMLGTCLPIIAKTVIQKPLLSIEARNVEEKLSCSVR